MLPLSKSPAPTAPAYQPSGMTAEPESLAPAASSAASLGDWVRLLRPKQWVKNAFVIAPLLFSGRALQADAVLASLGTLALFCLLASGIYVLNDIVDRVADRSHPIKRNRPIASGRISPRTAAPVGVALVVAALWLGFVISPMVFAVGVAYLLLNIFYSIRLKHVVIVDVFCIAAFFLLRLLGGTAAIHVHASVWLLLCGGLLALYLGFAKRRHELVTLQARSSDHRAVLTEYSAAFLDQMSMVLLSVTVVSYIMYTLTSETAKAVGGEWLSYSTVFVLFGVFRYLFLVHRDQGGNPAETLLTDKPLLTVVVLWLLYCGGVLYRPF